MLVNVRMSAFLPSLSFRSSVSRVSSASTLAAVAALALPLALAGCSRASAGTTAVTASPQAVESARQQLDLIPPPSKTRYMAVHSLSTWENPYLTVENNMATLHVTLADANPSPIGQGGMLRPVGARQQNITIRLS